ncbi:MAG TPA: hypothetical protein VHB27_22365, partial [Rhodopila sp.]|uniref:hypothetical protein n=1 Tax=Rhodopila sp. TaxID=2480087 RepID=UPI002CB99908
MTAAPATPVNKEIAMPIAQGLTAVRVFRPGRRVALICLVVAAASAVTSLALGSPLSRPWTGSGDIDWLPFVGGALPLLAMGISAVGLFGGKAAPAAMPQVETLIRQLNETLSGQREEVARLQRACDTATEDAANASARIGRVADAAIDAETRLASGMAQWERKWEEHLAAASPYGGATGTTEESLAARVVQRIEGVMPDFADIIRTKFSAFPDPSFHIAASRLNATVEAAMVTFKGVIDDAAVKMASLNEISQSLRRDAVALDLAGREIATAGATVVARAGEAISGVDAALASLPAALVSVTGAAAEMKGSLEEATLAMRANRTALMTAGDQAAQAAGRLLAAGSAIEAQREAVDDATQRITVSVAEVVARVDAAQADRTTMAELVERLREASDVLTQETGTLTQAGKDAAGGADATLVAIRAAAGEMIEQIRDALAPLPAATAELAAAGSSVATEISARVAERIEAAANVSTDLIARVDTAIGSLAEASRIAPETITERLGSQIEAVASAARLPSDLAETLAHAVAERVTPSVVGQIDAALGAVATAAQLPPDLAETLAHAVTERVTPSVVGQIDAALGAVATAAQLPPDLAETLAHAV